VIHLIICDLDLLPRKYFFPSRYSTDPPLLISRLSRKKKTTLRVL